MNKILLIIPLFALIFTPAFGQIQTSITVTTDKPSYSEGETILVTGKVRDLYSGTPVSIIVKAPNGNLVSQIQILVNADKKFSVEITAGGALMKEQGSYIIIAQYGTENRSATTSFEFGGSKVNPPSSDSTVYDTTISVSTDKSFYLDDETILVTGEVRDLYSGTPVSVIILSPEYDTVSISQVVVNADKQFSTEITAGGTLMIAEGIYTITVQYGIENRSATTSFEFGGSSSLPSDDVTDIPPSSSDDSWQDKYFELLSNFNNISAKVGELQKENKELKIQVNELESTVSNLNAVIQEQIKVIYDWILSK